MQYKGHLAGGFVRALSWAGALPRREDFKPAGLDAAQAW
jgi:hypothetical protein